MLKKSVVVKKVPVKRRRRIKLYKQQKEPILELFSNAMKKVIYTGLDRLKGHHYRLLQLKTAQSSVEKHRQMMRHK